MYIYMLPLSSHGVAGVRPETIVPAADGGVEHTAASFDSVSSWLSKAKAREIMLLPPQQFLLTLLSKFLKADAIDGVESDARLRTEREELLDFVRRTPTTSALRARDHHTSAIPWAQKIISPGTLFIRNSDKRIVLGLDKPGPELKNTSRGGDIERVVLVRFTKAGPVDVEVRDRQEIFDAERVAAAKDGPGATKL